MNIEFHGPPTDDLHREAVLIDGAVDGRPVRFRFTRDAVRSVAPSAADGRDLIARLASRLPVFAAVIDRKLSAAEGDRQAELTITEADILADAEADAETTMTYVVTGRGIPDEPCGSEAEAVAIARARGGSGVVCYSARGHYVARQTIWPAAGPIFTSHD
jgi:hypothetical protein